MLYGTFTFDSTGSEIGYFYSESLQEAKNYIDRVFSSIKKGHTIGVWEMDEFGEFDTSVAKAIVHKKK